MYKSILLLLLLLLISCGGGGDGDVTNSDADSANGKIAFYQGNLPTTGMKVFLTTIQITHVPITSNYLAYQGGYIVADSDVNESNEYHISNIPPGNYYLNIGYVLDSYQTNFDTIPPIMSYHSTTPEIQVNKDQQTNIGETVLYPGGFDELTWRLSTSPDSSQGFNFTTNTNVPYAESDIWFDGDNDLLVSRGNNIALLPNEPEGLSNYTLVPSSGFTSQIYIPYVQPSDPDYVSQFVVRTQLGTYVKMRVGVRGEGSMSPPVVDYKHLIFSWFHQSDGSTTFEY